MKTRFVRAAITGGLALLFATAQANAAVFVSVELVNPGTAYPTFSSPTSNPLADSTTGIVNQNVIGTIPNTQRSPFDDTAGAATPASAVNAYTAVLGGASATYNYSTLSSIPNFISGVSFLWGSPDFFNKVEFFNGTTSLGSVSSLQLTNPNGNPPQNPATGQSWVVVGAGTTSWTSVVFSSTTNAFEFASLQGSCTPEGRCGLPPPIVPLPAALPLFAGGLGALGVLGWRRKRKQAA